MKKYIFISPGSETSNQMLSDLKKYNSKHFEFIECAYNIKNKVIKNLFECYFKLNAKISLPFNCIWKNAYSISQIKFNKDIEYYIILGNGDFNYYTSGYLNKLKKKYNIHYIVYFIDPLSGLMSEFMRNNIFNLDIDLMYSFDYWDAKRIEAIHTMDIYSKKEINTEEREIKDSVFFVGSNKKDRIYSIHEVWDRLNENEIHCDFYVVDVPANLQIKDMKYNKRLSYDEVLEKLQKYECILEILQDGQSGVTLRYYEAIAYNKKLITNNKLVKELPFYNPKYMFIFDKIEDIDEDWIKEKIEVDYGYNGEFSPVNFIKDIEKRTVN